jgi:ribosomal protein S18 acetylase RimI-like enzyme
MRAFQLQLPRRNKAAAIFYRKAGFRELPRRVMLMEVRPEEVVQARRASASKRR